ncbi:MAG: translation initiation factor IF-2 [Gammaproteobacteria bacterium]|nr:translation initiation factor IF-2 [Gammaproteobacteria bacterium]MYF27624.1 translation initiation factor IF-2 [Gammaproteobacteria bacterium]MYK46188.1 translation initiation factor IF-2 [Gammaproteobacteria bacterium]
MVDVTVGQLASTLKRPSDDLLKLMQQAGLPHERDDEIVSDDQKTQLLSFVRRRQTDRAEQQKQITVRRRNVSTLRTGKGGRGTAVKVETRKKKVFVRRPAPPTEAGESLARAPAAPTQAQIEAERIREEDTRRKAAEEEARRQEAQRKAEEEERRQAEVAAKAKAEAEAREAAQRRAEATPEAVARAAAEAAARAQAEARAAESGNRRAPGRAGARHRDRATREDDFGDGRVRRRELSLKSESRRTKRRHLNLEKQGGEFEKPQEVIVREVEIGEMATVGELAQRMSIKAGEAIKTLMGMGVMATINQVLDQDTAVLLVEEMGHKVKLVAEDEVELDLEKSLQVEGERHPRPPVVTVMGHVDHGKTSLLDYIRHTRVVAGEAGGITQHIGAYNVATEHGEITFIDTPGHAAFTAMRARGAKSTDVVILVVAADDGVMPQTEEAVQHAQAAEVPLVVAVNKMDLEGADPERVKNELSAVGVIPEDWGGTVQFVEVSAETGVGIDALLEAVTLQAELLELTAVPEAPGQGVVIESRLDRGRGPVATLLVQNGTLKRGDVIVAGECFGRVRALTNERGESVAAAPPSAPVEMLGLNGTPEAGDEFSAVTGERQAREVADFRAGRSQAQRHASQKVASFESMFASLGQGEKRVLKLIVKADVRGSLEAITKACSDIGNDEVSVNVLASGVGGITESDANMAMTYGAAIFGFNTRADRAAKVIIERESIDLRYYSVIYQLLDDIKAILEGMLAPEVREEILGVAEVREVFHSPRFGQIAGCMVTDGTVARNRSIRVLRDNVVIFEGELESLRRIKDDVTEVRNGLECGIGVRNYNDVRVGDLIEVYESTTVARALGVESPQPQEPAMAASETAV